MIFQSVLCQVTREEELIRGGLGEHGLDGVANEFGIQKAIPTSQDMGENGKSPYPISKHTSPIDGLAVTVESRVRVLEGCCLLALLSYLLPLVKLLLPWLLVSLMISCCDNSAPVKSKPNLTVSYVRGKRSEAFLINLNTET